MKSNLLINVFDTTCAVLSDDIAFIQEVHAGEVEAPGMDPAHELAQLKRKFELWKREFRVSFNEGFGANRLLSHKLLRPRNM